ncbi:MAG: serine/threonine-protein kinase [Polyangiaceae bacterium]|nr:serine/threonine-protein kinase [Polyangiaceae bacterium]
MTDNFDFSPERVGPYELGEPLGAGGMAEVFKAEHVDRPGECVALKRILRHLARDARFVDMFRDEARISASLSHPNIVSVLDFSSHDGDLYLALEYVEGQSLAKLLRHVAAQKRRFPLSIALFIAREMLRGLAHAHSAADADGRKFNIIHRDVSPGNILLGNNGAVKLTDFGIVRSTLVDRRTRPGEVKGKLGYMSPEQVVGQEVDPRSDLFSVGIILTEMLLARPLFAGRSDLEILTRTHQADVSLLERYAGSLRPDLSRVLFKALARRPEERFQSADDFLTVLEIVARRAGVALKQETFAQWMAEFGAPERKVSGTREINPANPTTYPLTVREPKAQNQ